MKKYKKNRFLRKYNIQNSVACLLVMFSIGQINAQEQEYSAPERVDELSSYAEESLPLYDESNRTMYVVRTMHQNNTGGKKSGNEIWSFNRNEKQEWIQSEDDFSNLNDKFSNAVVGVVKGSTKIYLLNKYYKQSKMESGLSYSTYKKGKWSFPKNVKLDWMDNGLSIYNIFINDDDNIMLLSMKTKTPDSTYSVFISEKKESIWSKPVLLGDSVSSTTSDEISPYLSKNGKYIYFSSNRDGGLGDFDVYKSEMRQGLLSWSEAKNIRSLNSPYFDAYLSEGELNNVYLVSNRLGKLSDVYTANRVKGVEKVETKPAVVRNESTSNEKIISIHPNVNFAFDKYNLNKSAVNYLDKIADSLNSNKKWKIILEGHTDNIGTNAYNRNLSENRALSVRNYLIIQGVGASRIKILTFGERDPLVPNSTDYGRYQNRRVELTFIKK